jgi:hypothetical protein
MKKDRENMYTGKLVKNVELYILLSLHIVCNSTSFAIKKYWPSSQIYVVLHGDK